MFGVCLGRLGVLTHAGWATLNHWVTESEYLVLQLSHLCIGQFESMVHRICQENWTYVSPIEVACILKKKTSSSFLYSSFPHKQEERKEQNQTHIPSQTQMATEESIHCCRFVSSLFRCARIAATILTVQAKYNLQPYCSLGNTPFLSVTRCLGVKISPCTSRSYANKTK